MNFRVLQSVDAALDRVVTLLDSARPGTGFRLYAEFLAALDTIRANPSFFPMVEDAPDTAACYREALLLRATYRVVYQIRDTEIVVVALRHSHRRPGSWHGTTTDD